MKALSSWVDCKEKSRNKKPNEVTQNLQPKKREKFFVITDLYLFRGVSTEKDKINNKLNNIETYLKNKPKNINEFID